MRIAIDLRPLQIGHEHRGIGAYLINILSRMPRSADNHYIFYQFDINDPLKDHKIEKPESYELIKIPKPVWRRSLIDLIKYVKTGLYPGFPKLASSKPDVFLQPDFQLGVPKVRSCRKFVVMYDLIPIILSDHYMPSWKKPLFNPRYRWYTKLIVAAKKLYHQERYLKNLRRLRKASEILSISQTTTDDIHQHLGISKSKIATIPLAASFRKAEGGQAIRQELVEKLSQFKRPYIAYIGGTDARRKIDELIYAFNILNARGTSLDLVLAGNEFQEVNLVPSVEARNAIIASSYKKHIHLLGFLSEAEKEYILMHAAAFVYPTLYEGFGLPILEAMQAGCPVVAFNNSSIPEVGGTAIAYAPTQDRKGIQQAILDVINNTPATKLMVKKGLAQAAKFNWDKSAEQTWQTILRV